MGWKEVVAREKTKFKMNIERGKKVKWHKREEQSMRFEMNYIMKTSDLVGTNVQNKK